MKKMYMRKTLSVFITLLTFVAALSAQNVTVNPGAGSYATLKAAFDAINAGTHTGAVTVSIVGNTTEPTGGAILKASGTGSASYTSINITPVGARTISGAVTAGLPLIDLAGADNVTINGLNTGGNSLTITNSTVSGMGETSTIRFFNGATNNTITNATVLGSSVSASLSDRTANILISRDTITGLGNNNNTISNCNIGPEGSNLPTKGIMSYGTGSGALLNSNKGIVIDNNNVFDCFNPAAQSAAIHIDGLNTDISITNNRIYQTATRTQTLGDGHFGINIRSYDGNNFQVTGNTIGFASSTGTGTYTFVGVNSSRLIAIALEVGTDIVSNVSNNTIAGFALSGSMGGLEDSAPLRGIFVIGGLTKVNGNTIGSQTITGSITYTSSTPNQSTVIAISNFGSSVWETNNNNIGGITASAPHMFGEALIFGIYGATYKTWVANDNVIGGTVANSLQSTSIGNSSRVQGIYNRGAPSIFTRNIIRNLTAAGGTYTSSNASVVGISFNPATFEHTVSQNTIFNLTNTNTTDATKVTGIDFYGSGGTANSLVERNLITGLMAASNNSEAEVNGIRVSGAAATYRNNMISIGVGTPNAIGGGLYYGGIHGINITVPFHLSSVIHNSVYIGGNPISGTGSSFAFKSSGVKNIIRNNIFYNARSNSGATGKNYSVSIDGTTPNPPDLTINNNVYYANGSGAVFGFYNAMDVADVAAWQTAVGQDANSIYANPNYVNPAGTPTDLHVAYPTPVDGAGFLLATVNDDFDGQLRSSFSPVDIGADAGNYACLPAFNCPANRDVNLNGSCALVVPDLVTGLTADPACGDLTFTQNPTAGTVVPSSHIGTVSVVITPNNPLVAPCTVVLTGKDVTSPTATCQNVTVNLNAAGMGSTTAAAVNNGSSDACGINTLSLNNSTFGCANVGANTVVLTVTDVNGNSATCSATVTVVDAIPPTATCQNVTVNLNAAGMGSTTAAAVNNGSSDACGINTLSLNNTNFTCTNVGANTVVLTVTDVNGNSATCSATVTVVDAVPPTATCQNVTVNLNAAGMGSTTAAAVNNGSSDACGINTLSLNNTNFTCTNVGANTVVLTVTDVNGNSATCSATVTVVDAVPPTATCQNMTVNLNAAGMGSTTAAAVNNGSSDACGINTLSLNSTNFTCTNVGTNTVVLTVTDVNGNSATCSATVTVVDAVPPTATCQNVTVNLNASGTGSTTAAAVNNGSSDACGINTLSLNNTNFTCANVGANTVVLTVTDVNGNSATCSATVTVVDGIAPMITCPGSVVVCFPTVPTYIPPVGTDNCANPTTALTTGFASGGAFPIGTTVTTYQVTDASGNTATCTFNVTINPLPNQFTVTGGGQRCATDNIGVAVGLSGSQTGISYQLQFNNANVGAPVNGTGLPITFGTQLPTGTYSVIATNTVTGCSTSMTGTVTVSSINCEPSISDPCACLNNATTLTNGQFGEQIKVNAPSTQTWTVTAVNGLFTTTSAAPPAAPTPITVGTVLTNVGGNMFTLNGRHIDAIGYTITVSNGAGTSLSIGNTCAYPNPSFTSNLTGPFCLYSDPVTLTGNPGDANIVSQGFTVNGVPATSFNPGAGLGQYTIVYTVNGGVPKANGANDPGCIQSVSTIVSVVATPTAVSCNDLVQISLDADCSVEVTPDMILEGSYACFDDYEVSIDRTLPLGNGPWATPVVLGVNDIGKTWAVKVTHLVGGNSCWGLIKVEDKLAPVVTCNTIAISCAETNTDPAYLANVLGITNAYPTVVENCSNVTYAHNDVWTDLECPTSPTASSITGFITRTWIVTDASGNTASCTQTINIVGARVYDVNFPADAIISCAANVNTSPSATGTPFITFNYPSGPKNYPIWPGSNYCELQVTYADQLIPVCDGTYKILRTWTAYDWCLPTSPFPPTSNPQYYVQLVKVVDETGPSIEAIDDVVASTNANTCCANVDLPNVIVGDACSRIASAVATIYGYDQYTGDLIGTFTVNGTLTTFPGNNLWTPDTLATFGFTPCLPIGNHEVIYTITDDCGNSSTYSFDLTVEDQTPPQVAADEWTQISIGVDGMAFINAETFDDGSYDNCGPVYFKARRMDNNPCQITDRFHPQVKFCCEDIGDTIMVIFRVYDVDPGAGTTGLEEFEGHYSDVMVQVLVEDKLKPLCVAPANVTVSCEAFDPSLWAYGQATATDNCSNPTITGTVVYTQFDSLCNKGTITRRWTATDAYGNTSQCTQRVIVTYNQNYWVKFPADRLVSTCDGTTAYGAPEFYGEDCELLATSYTDEFFTVIPDACYKIERTWRVINWCTYNPNNSTCQFVPNPNPNNTTNHPTNLPGVTVSPLGTTVPGWAPTVVRINPSDPQPTNYSTFWNKETNCYTYKQIIKVFDTQDPTVSPAPTEFCDLSTNDPQFYNAMQYWDAGIASHDLCEGDANIELTATDACSGASLNFRYLLFLDLDGNGSMETVVNSVAPLAYNTLFYDNATAVNFVGGTPWNFDFRPVPNDRKWAFGLQVDNAAGNSRTARVRWVNQVGQNAVPQLPYGNHKIKWFVEDGCGNETVYEHAIVVKDCKKPTVVCLNGLSVNLMNVPSTSLGAPGMIALWASDFLQYTEDNCTPANLIKIGIRRVGQADGQGNTTGFPKNANGTPQTGVNFTCADLGTQLVELWGLDVAGNADYCETYVLIQDNAGVCGTNANIAGALKNDAAQGVEDATVELEGSSANGIPAFGEVFSQVTGDYMFSNALPFSGNATVTPTMEIDPLNGVNTWDLILISRHILGLEPLNTPYKLIAADANKSGTVTTFDIVELRKLILGTYQQLPNNSSWRFVDKSQVFTNPANPFADVIRENIQIANIQTNVSNGDFVAAKIGDVDGTATPNNLVASDDRTAGTLLFDIQDRAVTAGETLVVSFTADQVVKGYQFTMNLNGLEVESIEGSGMTTENFAVFGDAVTTSWDAPTVFNGKASYTVTFTATKSGKLSEMLSVSSRITKALAFLSTSLDESKKLDVAFRFNNGGNSTIAGQAFELYQNAPNPWVNKTQIGFYLPEASEAVLTVFDASGRILATQKGDFAKGYNAFTLDRKMVGVSSQLYYKVETATDSAVKTMQQVSK